MASSLSNHHTLVVAPSSLHHRSIDPDFEGAIVNYLKMYTGQVKFLKALEVKNHFFFVQLNSIGAERIYMYA